MAGGPPPGVAGRLRAPGSRPARASLATERALFSHDDRSDAAGCLPRARCGRARRRARVADPLQREGPDRWETVLRAAKPGDPDYGLNRDPEKVFTVATVDGGPVIAVSGKYWGGLITTREYGDYHLRLEFKWGTKRWPPRAAVVRDSGLLYHCAAPAASSRPGSWPWPRSVEFNITEHDTGEFYSVAGSIADAEVEPVGDSPEERTAFQGWCERNEEHGPRLKFRKGGQKRTFDDGSFMPGGRFRGASRHVERPGSLRGGRPQRSRRQRQGGGGADRPAPEDRARRGAADKRSDPAADRERGDLLPQARTRAHRGDTGRAAQRETRQARTPPSEAGLASTKRSASRISEASRSLAGRRRTRPRRRRRRDLRSPPTPRTPHRDDVAARAREHEQVPHEVAVRQVIVGREERDAGRVGEAAGREPQPPAERQAHPERSDRDEHEPSHREVQRRREPRIADAHHRLGHDAQDRERPDRRRAASIPTRRGARRA